MTVNELLIWMAVGATIVQGMLAMGSPRGGALGWLIVSVLVLAGVWVTKLTVPALAGLVGVGTWALLLGVPQTGAWLVERRGRRRDYAGAARAARLVALMHPFDGWPQLQGRLAVTAALDAGDTERACDLLAEMMLRPGSNQLWATVHLHQLCGWWDVLAEMPGEVPELDDPYAHPVIFHAYLRALGELGDLSGMGAAYAERYRQHPRQGKWRVRDQLVVAAFSGRDDLVFRVLASPNAPLRPEEQALWMATANQVKGETWDAVADLDRLIAHGPPDMAERAKRRKASPAPKAERVNDAGELPGVLAGIAREHAYVVRADRPPSKPWATWTLMLALTGVFIAELPGGSMNAENLYELGMLVLPLEVVEGGWWRFFTAGFLHFGPLHFILNGLALMVFGHALERFIGPLRFLSVYLAANVGAMGAVALFGGATMAKPLMIVGASGGVMGLLGAIMAVMLRALMEKPEQQRAARFMAICLLVALQLTFDAMNPLVSQVAHIGGLSIGLVLAMTLIPGRAIRRVVYPSLAS